MNLWLRHVRMRRWLPVLLTFAFATIATAQSNSLDEYLFANHSTLDSSLHAELPAAPTRRWLESPELRIAPERDINNFHTETYSLRFRPTSRKERRSALKLFDTDNDIAAVKWRQALAEVLAQRYHNAIDLAAREAQLALLREHLAIDRALFSSEQILSATNNFAATRLLDAALKIERREQALQQAHDATRSLRDATVHDYLKIVPDGRATLSERLLRPAAIDATLSELEPVIAHSPDRVLSQLALTRAAQELALEQKRSGFGLSLLELSYENKGSDSYNVTLGFRLPYAQRKGASARYRRDVAAARQSARLTEQLLTDAVRSAAQSIRVQIKAHAEGVAAVSRVDERLQALAANADAQTLLRRHRLALLDDASETHAGLLHDYVDFLALVGALGQQPLQNWIAGERQ